MPGFFGIVSPNLSDLGVEQHSRVENPEVKAFAAWPMRLPLQPLILKSAFMGLSTKLSGLWTHPSLGFGSDRLIQVPIIR
jgi:hypothetical protein